MTEAGLVAIAVALINAVAWIIGAFIANKLRREVGEVKHATNSMKDELIRLALMEGNAIGRKEQRDENALQKSQTEIGM